MKNVLSLLAAMLLVGSLQAQAPLFQENFDSGSIPSTWTMYNDENIIPTDYAMTWGNFPTDVAWFVSSQVLVNYTCAVSASHFTNPNARADRWLITPAIPVTEEHTFLSFFASIPHESTSSHLLVKVSTDSTDKESFTTTLLEITEYSTNNSLYYYVDLSAFIGETIHIAFVNNTLCGGLTYLDNVEVKALPPYDASTYAVITPDYAPVGEAINVRMTIRNRGYETITGFKATYFADGVPSQEMLVSDVSIPMGEPYHFTHSTPYVATDTGSKTFTIAITDINGSGTDAAVTDNVSDATLFYDGTHATQRANILEQFSTEYCGACPQATQAIKQVLTERNDVIWLVHHAGFGSDIYASAASKALVAFYGGRTFAPAMMINRYRVDENEPTPVNSIAIQTTWIHNFIDKAAGVPSFGSVRFDNMEYKTGSRRITGTVSLHIAPDFIPANPMLSIFFAEDSIVSNNQAGANGAYMHMRAARDCLTDNFGDSIVFDANGNATYKINYKLPSYFNAEHGRLVAILANYNPDDINDCVVINAAETNYLPNVGIHSPCHIEVGIFPNPASQAMTIVAEESIRNVRITNSLGQVVYSNSSVHAESLQLNVNDYAAGLYIVTVTTAQGIATQRIAIRR